MIRSVKQRDLLNAWLRVHRKRRALPATADYQPDRIGPAGSRDSDDVIELG